VPAVGTVSPVSDEPFPDLGPTESELRGRWIAQPDGRVGGDRVDERIRWLTIHRLEALATTSDGWDWLFRDPRDGRLWELTFPQGSLHGSGPRLLTVIDPELALARYGHA
jgi:hypothetical protein